MLLRAGTIPVELSRLKHLKTLILSKNKLEGECPGVLFVAKGACHGAARAVSRATWGWQWTVSMSLEQRKGMSSC